MGIHCVSIWPWADLLLTSVWLMWREVMGQGAPWSIPSAVISMSPSPAGLPSGCVYAAVDGGGRYKLEVSLEDSETSLTSCLCWSVDLWKDNPWGVFKVWLLPTSQPMIQVNWSSLWSQKSMHSGCPCFYSYDVHDSSWPWQASRNAFTLYSEKN